MLRGHCKSKCLLRLRTKWNAQADSTLFNPNSMKFPAQLLAMLGAAEGEGLPPGFRRRYTSTFSQLLQGMLHPDAARRITASQMLALLQSPVLNSLKKRPFCI